VSDDIEQVRRVEMRRGKRPIDVDAVKERQRIAAALREILHYGTIDDLKTAMRAFGLSEERQEWVEALRLWSVERGQK